MNWLGMFCQKGNFIRFTNFKDKPEALQNTVDAGDFYLAAMPQILGLTWYKSAIFKYGFEKVFMCLQPHFK